MDRTRAWQIIARASPACGLGAILLASRFIDPASVPGMCVFRLITGIPCMFCGLTHAFHALSLGNIAEAMDFHPLVIPAYSLVVFHFLMACLRGLGWKHLRLLPALTPLRMIVGTFVIFSLVWILRLAHIIYPI